MPQHHSWGWYSPQIASYIHIRHIQRVWAIGMLSQGHMRAPLYCYTSQVASRFGKPGSPDEWKWYHNIMVEADIHLRLRHTSILDIYKVFEPLVCCLKGIWLHVFLYTLAKLPPDLGIQVTWGVKMMPQHHGWGWYPPQTALYIHISHIQSVWAIGMLSQVQGLKNLAENLVWCQQLFWQWAEQSWLLYTDSEEFSSWHQGEDEVTLPCVCQLPQALGIWW